jgi:DnaJ-class molecular chaperone
MLPPAAGEPSNNPPPLPPLAMNDQSKTKTPPAEVKCLCHACNGGGFAASKTGESTGIFCAACQGAGSITRPVAETKRCPECKGAAQVEKLEKCSVCHGRGSFPSPNRPIPCSSCHGRGKLPLVEPCHACAGAGRVARDPSAPVKAPPVDNSAQSRLDRIESRLTALEKAMGSQTPQPRAS